MGYMYHLSVLCIFTTSLLAAANGLQAPVKKANVARFTQRATGTTLNLTEAEAHAKWLTSRKPTRRSTAYRRQESEVPFAPTSSTFSAVDEDSGADVGSLVYGANGWTVSEKDDGSTITSFGLSNLLGRDAREAQRLVYSTSDNLEAYRYFGIGQCNPGSPTNIGVGSANVLCLVNSVHGTRAGALPTLVENNLDRKGSSYVETDVWTLDYSHKTATAVWINPDGTATRAHIVVAVNNPNIVFVTGDVAATSALYKIEFRSVTLSYKSVARN